MGKELETEDTELFLSQISFRQTNVSVVLYVCLQMIGSGKNLTMQTFLARVGQGI